MMNKKYYMYGGAALAVLVIAIIFVVFRNQNANRPDAKTTPQSQSTSSTTSQLPKTATTTTKAVTKPVAKTPVVKKGTTSVSATESYLKALETYKKSGFYIQFYPCQATPGLLTVKKGTKIMLDNRDSKTHVIAIKTDKYTIAGYNYAIAALNNVGVNYITCDGGGSAMVSVQP